MSQLPLSDTELMERIARSQADALAGLYDRFGRLVFTVAIHVVGDVETAQEVTQDVFLRVWEGAKTYRPEAGKVSSWLVSIARHRAIDELRRRGVRPEKARADWPEDIDQDGMAGLPVIESPEGTVETGMQRRVIQMAIASLPHEQRVALNLAFMKGLSHSQIAEMLGEPLGTVKSRVRLAMLKLREILIEKHIVDPGPGDRSR